MRLINAVREWNAEGRPPLHTIALYTAVDRRAMFVREADEAVLIGPDDPDGGQFGATALPRLRRAGAGAARVPGPTRCGRAGGSCRRRPSSRELCDRLGITFVGPSPEVMRRLGDKIESKRLAEQVGVPLAAWSGGPVADLEQAREQAEGIGYPLMVKATAGGGGRGIRLVNSSEELDEAFERASSEAGRRRPGDATVFLERAIRGGRHVEVQVVADARRHGVDAGRPGLQRAAAQPEGDRGVGVDGAGRRAGGAAALQRGRAGAGGRLRQRRHRGVPLRAQGAAAVVPGGQHAAAGRAPGDRGDHRGRHRQAAAARGGRRAAGRDRAGGAGRARARDRGPAHRGGPGAGLRPRARV